MAKNKLVDLLKLSEFKKKIVELIPIKVSQLENDEGYIKKDETVLGVKGNNETDYRTGDVNITATNVGALSTTGGTISGTAIQLLAIKNVSDSGDVALKLIPGNEKKGYILLQSNYREDGNQFLVVCTNEKGEWINLITLSENIRQIYDYKTNSFKEILVVGDSIDNCTVNGKKLSDAVTIYDVATTSTNGLMSSTDKSKLDGVATEANNTSLTNSLTATVTGTALDATQGKILDDKGAQISVYKDDDDNLHFRDWTGADTVIPFSSSYGSDIYFLPGTSADFTSIITSLGKTVNDYSVSNFKPVFNTTINISYSGVFTRGNTSAAVYGGSISGVASIKVQYNNGVVSLSNSGTSSSKVLNNYSASLSASVSLPTIIGFIFDPSDISFT